WLAVDTKTRDAENVMFDVPIEIPGDKQIEFAVVIVIEKSCRSRPAASFHTCQRRHVGECPITIIVIEHVTTVTGEVDIRKPVVIIIPRRNAHAIVRLARAGESRLLGDVRKATVVILTVQTVPVGWVAAGELSWQFNRVVESAAVYKKNVDQPIVVVIQQGHSAAHRFNQVLLRRGGVVVNEVEASRTSDSQSDPAAGGQQGDCYENHCGRDSGADRFPTACVLVHHAADPTKLP